MTTKTEVQIFVSCPGDVEELKGILKSTCKVLSNSNDGLNNIIFSVKDWKEIIGKYGERPQEQINQAVGKYDIYIGILWKRFGTPPGATNPLTSLEFGSGTEEEFTIALQNWKLFQVPEIYFFIRKDKRTSNNEYENEQLSKVFKFITEQRKSNQHFLNEFEKKEGFRNRILHLLNQKQQEIFLKRNSEEKQSILKEEPNIDLNQFRINIQPPDGYVLRFLVHYEQVKERSKNVLVESTQESLNSIINNKQRIIILGDAGSGKSTELKNLAYILDNKESPYLPIIQNFNSYTPEQGIENFLPEFWKKIPHNLLVLIWDGLDEIQPNEFNTVVRQINSFVGKYPEIRIVISCRTNFYETPTINSPGTLIGFEPFYINDLRIQDAKQYYSSIFKSEQADSFIHEVFKENLDDLLSKPFFLMLLSNIYSEQKNLSLNRAHLYEAFLLKRINLDEAHYKNTFDLKHKKEEIVNLLERVALSMEIFAKNSINESDLLKLISSTEFSTIRFCTAFKKKEGEETVWQFEHNNIQEFLAARALSKLPFEKVIKFITFEPDHIKIIPSWVNTLTFLFSILDNETPLFKELLDWLVNNEKELVVKFEVDKISEEIRIKIFEAIFNYYKEQDIGLNSNKFSDKELAQFTNSENGIKFLIKEIQDKKNSKTVKNNALHIIGYFEFLHSDLKLELKNLLFNIIDENIEDEYIISIAVHALEYSKIYNEEIISQLMLKLGERKNRYIRSSIYSLLLESNLVDAYVDYIIEGYKILDDNKHPERGDVSFLNESWNLKECLKAIKSPLGIKKTLNFILENAEIEYTFDFKEIFDTIIKNAVEAYFTDISIYIIILKLFKKLSRHFRHDTAFLIIPFFDETETREKAFHDLWSKPDNNDRSKYLALSLLLNEKLFDFVIEQYNNHNIINDILNEFIIDLSWIRNSDKETFIKIVERNTSFKLERPPVIDYDAIRKTNLQNDFNLLFDKAQFLYETLRIFNDEEKEFFLFNELFEVTKKYKRHQQNLEMLEDYYSDISIKVLRSLCKDNLEKKVTKWDVVNWFNDKKILNRIAFQTYTALFNEIKKF